MDLTFLPETKTMRCPQKTSDDWYYLVLECLACIAMLWGLAGGWAIIGEKWPSLNTLTKDDVTLLVGLVLYCGLRNKRT